MRLWKRLARCNAVGGFLCSYCIKLSKDRSQIRAKPKDYFVFPYFLAGQLEYADYLYLISVLDICTTSHQRRHMLPSTRPSLSSYRTCFSKKIYRLLENNFQVQCLQDCVPLPVGIIMTHRPHES